MLIRCLFLLLCAIVIDADHFNGGTIRWVPLNPYDNSTSTTISIIQSYTWAYSLVNCATNVPITTSSYSSRNQNMSCVGNCSTDGGYSTKPVNILTDCTSFNSIMDVLTSQKSKNITLTSDAHFSLTYTGDGWRTISHPSDPYANWSMVFSIDLRQRPDGFINTPPTASVFSPQYAFVNTPIQIPIRFADVNTGDDVRCRWSTKSIALMIDECGSACYPASMPSGVTLSNCTLSFTGPIANIWYAAAIQVEDFINTTSNDSMSSVPVQFLIYVQSQPTCSQAPVFIPFTGCLEASVGVSTSFNIFLLNLCDPAMIDINDIVVTQSISGMTASTLHYSATNASLYYKTFTWTPQASQIGPQQLCLIAYTIEDVQSTEYCVTFNVIASSTPCATTTTTTTTSTSASTTTSTTTTASTSTSTTTTTTTTTSTSTSTTTTSTTTSTTTATTTSTTTTTTTTSTTTSTTTTTTTSTTTTTTATTTTTTTTNTTTTTTTTSTTTTTTSTTSTTTSTTSTTTTTTSTTTSTTTTTTSSTSTSTTTTTTSTTTSQTTTTITETDRSTSTPGKTTSWVLIAGISSVALPLALCSCLCLYRLLWSPAAKRRRQAELEEEEEEDNTLEYNRLNSSTASTNRITAPQTADDPQIEVPKKSYQVYYIPPKQNTVDNHGSVLVSLYNNTNGRRPNDVGTHSTEESFEMTSARTKPQTSDSINSNMSMPARSTLVRWEMSEEAANLKPSKQNFIHSNKTTNEGNFKSSSLPSFTSNRVGSSQSRPETSFEISQPDSTSSGLKDWSRIYLFGGSSKTGTARMQKPS